MTQRDWFSKRTEGGRSLLSDFAGALPDNEFNEKTARFAEMLAERFPDRRSRIGLWGPNTLDYLVALFSILRAGHVALPLSTRLTIAELDDIARAAPLAGVLATKEYPQTHRAALASLPAYALAQKIDLTAPPPRRSNVKELGDKDVAMMICSSGSHGKVKIVPMTLRAVLDHAAAVCAHLQVTWRDSWVCCLPFYHVGGITIPFRCLVSGASLIVSQSADADELNHLVDTRGATLLSVVPTVLERMLSKREGREFPKTLRGIIVGGGPVPDALLARCPQAYATYGLTEAGSMVTCARPGCGVAERKTAGPPLPDTQIRIVNDNGKEVSVGQVGQIIMRGPGMAQSYVGDTEAANRTFKSGWIHTGDVGSVDSNGFLQVSARRSDVVISGGENIYPGKIEAVLLNHPRVTAAVVMPVDDPTWGQTPAAFLVISPGRPLQTIHIHHFLEGKLARYKFPKRIVFAETLPVLGNGKPDLAAIKKLLKA